MITYKDRTYCINKDCKKKCSCRLTKKIVQEANEFGLPVAVTYYDCKDKEQKDVEIKQ